MPNMNYAPVTRSFSIRHRDGQSIPETTQRRRPVFTPAEARAIAAAAERAARKALREEFEQACFEEFDTL